MSSIDSPTRLGGNQEETVVEDHRLRNDDNVLHSVHTLQSQQSAADTQTPLAAMQGAVELKAPRGRENQGNQNNRRDGRQVVNQNRGVLEPRGLNLVANQSANKSTDFKASREKIKSKLRLLHAKQRRQANSSSVDAKDEDEGRSKSKLGQFIEKIQDFFGRSKSP